MFDRPVTSSAGAEWTELFPAPGSRHFSFDALYLEDRLTVTYGTVNFSSATLFVDLSTRCSLHMGPVRDFTEVHVFTLNADPVWISLATPHRLFHPCNVLGMLKIAFFEKERKRTI